MSDMFFENLPSFTAFEEACNSEHYHPAPENWFIVLTDVRGSTKAIEDGRYKDVNMVGAACIVAVVNACSGTKIPYVFGGDGATFLIPPGHIEVVEKKLQAVASFSQKMHGLPLRIGILPMHEITKRAKNFGVAKFIMPTGATLAMFNGGGASLADELLKADDRFSIPYDDSDHAPDLEGLSCRWHPIPTRKGTVLTLLVMSIASEGEDDVYRDINRFIAKTLDADQNPIHQDSLSYKWPTFETLRQSQMVWRQANTVKKLFGHVFLISLFNIMNAFDLKISGLNLPQYKKDMITNSDYRKFDDMLRMVVDCTTQQAEAIEYHLKDMHDKKRIVYGTHYSDTALMTCFLETLEKDRHVHFIDGNNGGYALAAKQMKERLYSLQK